MKLFLGRSSPHAWVGVTGHHRTPLGKASLSGTFNIDQIETQQLDEAHVLLRYAV